MSYSEHPIECQYCERAWYYIFNCDKRLLPGLARIDRAASVRSAEGLKGTLNIAHFALNPKSM